GAGRLASGAVHSYGRQRPLAGGTLTVEVQAAAGHTIATGIGGGCQRQAQVAAVVVVDPPTAGTHQVRVRIDHPRVVAVARAGELQLGNLAELLEDAHGVVDGGAAGGAAAQPGLG